MVKLKTFLKVLLSVLLLGYLVYKAEPMKIVEVLGQAWYNGRLVYLFLAIGIYLLATIIYTWRWQILVKGCGLQRVTWLDLFKFYLIGLFFNNFLPTSIGGDVFRIYHLVEKSGDRTAGFTSVLTERLLGIAGTLILTLLALLLLSSQLDDQRLIYIASGLLFVIITFFIVVFNDYFLKMAEQMVKPLKVLRLGERIMKFFKAIRFYYNTRSIYLKILGTSIMGQILVIIMTYMLSLALGLQIPPYYLFLVVPISFLVTMLPSINGIGFREGVFVVLLGKVGISNAEAISLSFLSILIPMIVSMSGGMLFMLNKQVAKKNELEFVKENI
jgi:uncharacterized protein (TIRG00374 family)